MKEVKGKWNNQTWITVKYRTNLITKMLSNEILGEFTQCQNFFDSHNQVKSADFKQPPTESHISWSWKAFYVIFKLKIQQGCLIPVTGIKAHSVGGFVKMPRNNDTLTLHDKPIKPVSTITFFCNDKMWCVSNKAHTFTHSQSSAHTQCSSAWSDSWSNSLHCVGITYSLQCCLQT